VDNCVTGRIGNHTQEEKRLKTPQGPENKIRKIGEEEVRGRKEKNLSKGERTFQGGGKKKTGSPVPRSREGHFPEKRGVPAREGERR